GANPVVGSGALHVSPHAVVHSTAPGGGSTGSRSGWRSSSTRSGNGPPCACSRSSGPLTPISPTDSSTYASYSPLGSGCESPQRQVGETGNGSVSPGAIARWRLPSAPQNQSLVGSFVATTTPSPSTTTICA